MNMVVGPKSCLERNNWDACNPEGPCKCKTALSEGKWTLHWLAAFASCSQGIFLLTEPGLEAYIPSRLLACLAAGMGDGGGWNGGRWESVLVAAFAENSKPFRPFLVMVENVRIDCITDLPVSLTHLLRCSSSLPSSLVSRAGFCSANAALLLQHGYYVPHTATTEILP